MKKRKKHKERSLTFLYLDFIFQKTTWIIFIISILLMSIGVFFCSNPWMVEEEYILSSQNFHLYFFNQTIFIVQLFNSILIACFVISITLHAANFDTLFLSHISRKKICSNKFVSILILCFFLGFYEMVLLLGVAVFQYSRFQISIDMLLNFGFLILAMLFEAITSMVISTVLPVVFAPMLVLFVCIILRLLCNNFTQIADILSGFIPVIKINTSTSCIEMANAWVPCVWIILLFILLRSIYSMKDF